MLRDTGFTQPHPGLSHGVVQSPARGSEVDGVGTAQAAALRAAVQAPAFSGEGEHKVKGASAPGMAPRVAGHSDRGVDSSYILQ